MREHLQPWYDRWLTEHHSTDLLYVPRNGQGEIYLPQVHFVRDDLAAVMWSDIPRDARPRATPRDDCKESAFVIGEHFSKSVRLPVYSLERPDLGIRFVLRYNFHDWNLSVISEKPVVSDLRGFELDYSCEEDRKRFADGYQPGHAWGYCYFQGFPKDVQFGPWREDPRAFSLTIDKTYDVYTFMWIIMRDLR